MQRYAPAAPPAPALAAATLRGGGETDAGYIEEMLNDPDGLSEIKNTIDHEVVHSVCLRMCQSALEPIEIKILFCRDQYVVVATGFVGRITLAALNAIAALNAERYEKYNPIENVHVDLEKRALVAEVRKVECSSQVGLQQMLLVDRESAPRRKSARRRGDSDESDESDDGGGGRRRSRSPRRRRARSRSPPPSLLGRFARAIAG
jgi:hypothetical protein